MQQTVPGKGMPASYVNLRMVMTLLIPFIFLSLSHTSGAAHRHKAATGIDKTVVTGRTAYLSAKADTLKAVRGYVRDNSGLPLPGATILIKGTRKGTATDASGYFKLYVEPAMTNGELIITYTGYGIKTAKVDFSQMLNFVLTPSTNELDQVQVIAYGTTTKRFSTGNVSTVTAAEIAKSPVANPLLALQGRVPGLVISQTNGKPGSGINVQLRGQNTIESGSGILYIIDGVPINGGSAGSINASLAQGSLLDLVNPADIESIDVLKDADATSIYGSRGANGVILITTKRGRPGRTRINLNTYTGFSKVTTLPKYLNLQQYLEMRREAFMNDNAKPGPIDYDVNGTWDTTRYTDWQKELLGGAGHTSDLQGSISGGNDNIQYLVGGGYHRDAPVRPTEGSFKKGAAHFSITGTSDNKKLFVNASGNFVSNINTIAPVNPTSLLGALAPNAPAALNPDGTINWDNNRFSNNPYALLRRPYLGRSRQLNSNVIVGYGIIKGLDVKVAAGYQYTTQNEYIGYPRSLSNPSAQASVPASADYRTNWVESWNIEPQINYNFSLGKGSFETLLGGTFRRLTSEDLSQKGAGYTNDALLRSPQAAATLSTFRFLSSENKYNATFGRVKYNWDNKYMLTLNGRYDGSSRFGPDSRYHFFWSAGASWIFTQEQAVKDFIPFLSFGKLRGSYGTTGNDNVGDYSYYDLFSSIDYSYQGSKGLRPLGLFNPDLAWESTRKIEGAIDLGFLNDRILVTAAYYTNRSNNQLLPYALSAATGFSSIRINTPATVGNRGWEFELRTVNVKTKDFEWTSAFNIATPRNKLIRYDGLIPNHPNLEIGKPLNIRRVYEYAGIDPQTGSYQFLNSEGKAVATPDVKTAIIDPTVKYYGGLQNTVRYKNLSLDFLLQYANNSVESPLLNGTLTPPGFMGNQLERLALDRWQKPGDVKNIAKYSQSIFALLNYATYAQNSTLAYTNVGFVRLKNVYLSYQMPSIWMKRTGIQQATLFAQGQNLLTFTREEFKDADPETGGLDLAPAKIFTFGIKLTL